MAITQNTYTGNGSTVLYSFTFPYLATTDIKVSVNGTNTTAYTLANATTVQFTAAPSNGAAIRIFRTTDDAQTKATFFPGSSIRAQSLNENFTQNLYVTQEATNTAASATTVAAGAVTSANTALSQSTAAVSTANTASANATSAVNTANAAAANVATAVSTANTAAANAATAVTTANSAASTATAASTTAAGAVTTANATTAIANTAAANASSALTTANSANTAATTASSTAGSALTTATTALSTANSASTTATTATTTANTANSKADQALSAVSNSISYTLVVNVAAIPANPANDTFVEVGNSTGIENFTPLVGVPSGFVGDSGLSARIRYTTAGATWNFQNYVANNAETRYVKLAGGTLTGPLALVGAPTTNLQAATKQYVDTADALKAPLASPTFTGSVTIPAGAAISGYLSSATAASTYAPLASPTFTGTPTVPGYLTTSTAGSTYQPLSGMSSYLTTATAGTTYQTQAGMSNYLPTSSFATQAEAVAGTSTTTVMTPQRTLQAIQANPSGGVSLGLAIALG